MIKQCLSLVHYLAEVIEPGGASTRLLEPSGASVTGCLE